MSIDEAGTYVIGDRAVKRLGYGAMQLAGPGVFGPPRDHAAAVAVLREAVELGVDHIDTSDFYGPHVTNRLIRERCIPIPTISFWSPRSGRGEGTMRRGTRRFPPRSSSTRSATISIIWGWMR